MKKKKIKNKFCLCVCVCGCARYVWGVSSNCVHVQFVD